MFGTVKRFFSKVGVWVKSLIQKHDEQLKEMVKTLGPLVVEVAQRSDLSGEEKKKLIVDKVKLAAEDLGKDIALSVVNEAIEVTANKYKLEMGHISEEQLDNTLKAVLNAAK